MDIDGLYLQSFVLSVIGLAPAWTVCTEFCSSFKPFSSFSSKLRAHLTCNWLSLIFYLDGSFLLPPTCTNSLNFATIANILNPSPEQNNNDVVGLDLALISYIYEVDIDR